MPVRDRKKIRLSIIDGHVFRPQNVIIRESCYTPGHEWVLRRQLLLLAPTILIVKIRHNPIFIRNFADGKI